jgi:hypothetical protein
MKANFGPQNTHFILDFWGKARANNQARINTHPIAYHSLDVRQSAPS